MTRNRAAVCRLVRAVVTPAELARERGEVSEATTDRPIILTRERERVPRSVLRRTLPSRGYRLGHAPLRVGNILHGGAVLLTLFVLATVVQAVAGVAHMIDGL